MISGVRPPPWRSPNSLCKKIFLQIWGEGLIAERRILMSFNTAKDNFNHIVFLILSTKNNGKTAKHLKLKANDFCTHTCIHKN